MDEPLYSSRISYIPHYIMNNATHVTTEMFKYNQAGAYYNDRNNLTLPLLPKYDNILLKRNCQPSLIDLEKQFNKDYRIKEEYSNYIQYNLIKNDIPNEKWIRLERSNGYIAVSFLFLLFISSIFTIGVLKENQVLL